jgi:hypothetical protein
MKNVVGRRKFAPNPSEEMWMLAFPVGSKRKNQRARRQKNYCYVCVAKGSGGAAKVERAVLSTLTRKQSLAFRFFRRPAIAFGKA